MNAQSPIHPDPIARLRRAVEDPLAKLVRELDEQNARDQAALHQFTADHDDVLSGTIHWRGSLGNEFRLVVNVGHWTTLGVGKTLEAAYQSAFGPSEADAAVAGIVRAYVDQAGGVR